MCVSLCVCVCVCVCVFAYLSVLTWRRESTGGTNKIVYFFGLARINKFIAEGIEIGAYAIPEST